MKRLAVAAVAAATTFTLSATPAFAADGYSSCPTVPGFNESVCDMYTSSGWAVTGDLTQKISDDNEQYGDVTDSTQSSIDAWASLREADENNDWRIGTTLDIIIGTGAAALLLLLGAGAAMSGLIPGVALPF